MTWIMTGTGRKIDFITPDADQIWMPDIQRALSRNPRFGGHGAIVVAQHLIEVVHLMIRKALEEHPDLTEAEISEVALIAMIHDFPEYVLVDVPTPLKRLLGPAYVLIEERLLNCMLEKWQLRDAWDRWEELLKWADQDAVQQEAIRFRMDGFYIDEDLKAHRRPNDWVPQDRPINLHTAVWEEDAAAKMLGALWTRHMILSGRSMLLDKHVIKPLREAALEHKISLETIAREPLSGNADLVFTDHPGYLV